MNGVPQPGIQEEISRCVSFGAVGVEPSEHAKTSLAISFWATSVWIYAAPLG